jgi:hypothetical protein
MNIITFPTLAPVRITLAPVLNAVGSPSGALSVARKIAEAEAVREVVRALNEYAYANSEVVS